MIYRRMYVGYGEGVTICDSVDVIVSSVASYKGMTFLYFESENEHLIPDDFVKCHFNKFPDGNSWFRMTKIFENYVPKKREDNTRHICNKSPKLRINFLKPDMEGSYIHYHKELEYSNQVGVDKFYSIFIFGNLLIIYNEEPRELTTIDDIVGETKDLGIPCWDALMAEHFATWEDGTKGWIYLN